MNAIETAKRGRGRPAVYPFAELAIGARLPIMIDSPNNATCVRRNASQYGKRHGKRFSVSHDREANIMTVTRQS